MRVAYLVSRFPHVSETFIVRELDAVAAQPEMDLDVLSLFEARGGVVHPAAKPWVGGARRPSMRESLGAAAWWMVRRPVRFAGSVGHVVRGYWRRPGLCLRALACVPLAAAHARWLKDAGVDRVHAHYATYPALAAWLCMRLAGVPYSFTVHAHDIFVDQSMLARKVADADFVVAISEYNRRFLAAYGGDEVTPVHVVHCGVDPGDLPYAEHRVPREGPVAAVCVASLQEYKGHAVLLEAMAGGGPAAERLHLDLVGDGPLRAALTEQADALGIGARVVFHGSLEEGRVAELLAGADLFVLPSIVARDGQMEGLPVALMEALACGLVVVTTSISGIPELIRDGETGYLARPGEPADLAAALERSIEGPPLDHTVGRRVIEDEFDARESGRLLAHLFAHPLTPSA